MPADGMLTLSLPNPQVRINGALVVNLQTKPGTSTTYTTHVSHRDKVSIIYDNSTPWPTDLLIKFYPDIDDIQTEPNEYLSGFQSFWPEHSSRVWGALLFGLIISIWLLYYLFYA